MYAIRSYYARTLLPTVLKGIEPEINQFRGILVAVNPADAAFVLGFGRNFMFRYVRIHSYCLQYVRVLES